ncbi:hypothetical protein GGG16DRAFT_126241 [Schizophyllum commune]
MVLTLAPFSGVNVTSKIALWETRAQMQDSPAPMHAASRPEPSRIASFEAALPSSSCSLPSLSPPSSGLPPPSPSIGKICHARICYYVAETQEASPLVELAGIPPSVELAGLITVSLVSKRKTSFESTTSSPAPPFESATSRLPFEFSMSRLSFESEPSPLPFEPSISSLPFESMICSPYFGDATSPLSPSSTNSSLFSEASAPVDELDALDLEGVEPILDFPVAAPLSGLLWRRK